MDSKEYAFLKEIMGIDGAEALKKAAARSAKVESVLVPRAVLSWLDIVSDYSGTLPGTDTSIEFHKSEDGYAGSINLTGVPYRFSQSSVLRLAASVAVALGSDASASPDLKDIDLVRLGKSIDLLCRSHALLKAVAAEKMCKNCKKPYTGASCKCSLEKKGLLPDIDTQQVKPSTGTFQGQGGAHPPDAPAAVQQNNSTNSQNPNANKLNAKKSERVTKVSKSQSIQTCSVCGKSQFANGSFVGCHCLSALAKHVRCDAVEDGYHLRFNTSLDAESVLTILDAVRGE